MTTPLSCRAARLALLQAVLLSRFAVFGGEDTSCLIELDPAPARKAKATLLAAGTKSADSSYLSRFYYAKPENGQPGTSGTDPAKPLIFQRSVGSSSKIT